MLMLLTVAFERINVRIDANDERVSSQIVHTYLVLQIFL
jgi:hypothetical protein